MSYAVHPVPIINVNDPRIDIDSKREYVVLRGGQEVSFQQFPANNASNSSSVFQANPPGPGFIIDRFVKLSMPVKVNFSAATNTTAGGILTTEGDAFRSYPLASNMSTITLYVNNSSTSLPLSDIIQPLLRYHNPIMSQNGIYSLTPSEMDHTQNYEDLQGFIQNPLRGYGDSVFGGTIHRGSYPYTSYYNPNGGTTAQVNALIVEPIFVSPLSWGPVMASGLFGCQTFQLNITWNANLARLWSHGNVSGITGFTAFTNTAVPGAPSAEGGSAFGNPSLEFCYITPKITQTVPRSVSYPFYTVNRYAQTYTPSAPIAPGGTVQITMQNIQFSQVPRRVLLFARYADQVLALDTAGNVPDIYFPITKLAITFDNRQNLFASAQQSDLYNICVKNGINMSYPDFIGGPWTQFKNNTQYGLCGNVICIEFGTDIGLPPDLSAGVAGTFQFLVTATIQNANTSVEATDPISLYCIEVDEGIWTIENNSSIQQTSVLSKADVLNAHDMHPWVSYESLMRPEGGANFLNTLKSIVGTVGKVANVAAKVAPHIANIANTAQSLIPGGGILIGDGLGVGGMHHHRHHSLKHRLRM